MARPRRSPDLGDHDLIAASLRLLPIRRGQIDADEHDLITRARADGWTWQRVADALGLGSPQAAGQRYDALSAKVARQVQPADPQAPGVLLGDVLDGVGMSKAELARRTGLSAKHVNQVAQGVASVSADVAIRLESATGVPAMVFVGHSRGGVPGRARATGRRSMTRRRRPPWWVSAAGLTVTLAAAGWLMAEAARLVGIR